MMLFPRPVLLLFLFLFFIIVFIIILVSFVVVVVVFCSRFGFFPFCGCWWLGSCPERAGRRSLRRRRDNRVLSSFSSTKCRCQTETRSVPRRPLPGHSFESATFRFAVKLDGTTLQFQRAPRWWSNFYKKHHKPVRIVYSLTTKKKSTKKNQ